VQRGGDLACCLGRSQLSPSSS